MPQMPNVNNEPWIYPIVLSEDSHTVLFETANKYLDKNIKAEISVNSGSVSPYLDNTNLSTYFNSGTSSSNSISITPKATSNSGFISSHTTSDAITGGAEYYTIKTGTSKEGAADVNIYTTDGSNAGVNISAIVGTKTGTEPSSGYYLAFKGEGNSKINTAGWFVADASLTKTTSAAKYFPITAAAIEATSSDATATTTVAPGNVTIAGNTASVSGKSRLDYDPTTSSSGIGTYYIAIKANAAANSTGTTSSISGTTTASVTTAGYAPTTLTGSGSVSGTATAKTSSKDSSVYYIPVPTAVGSIAGTNTVTPTASLSQSNVTFSDTDNGISVTATGGGTASITANANITTAGHVPTGSNFSTVIDAANNTTTATKYITGVTVPASKSFSVTNGGSTTVTSNSTTAGTITIAAKTASGDSSNTSQAVVENGLWKTTAVTASGTYYGRVTVGSATVTTSSTNDGMSTYFNNGSSSDKDVTITPKYTNTAGYKAAVTSATNSGGTTYWKIKTASPVFDGGTLSGNSTATGTNVTLSDTDNGIKIQTAYTAARTAVLYNGAVAGWVSKADNAQALASDSLSSTNGNTYYVTAITVPKDKGFSITTVADTALDTTSDLDITNAAYRRIDITNAANGSVLVNNAGNITATQTAKTGSIIVNAYETSGSSATLGNKTIVENGVWKTTAASGADTYYGRVTVGAVNGSIGGSATAGSATAAISNVNSINASSTAPSGTAGTDYWQIKATATGSAGGYTPKYTVSTAGWIGSTVNGTSQTVNVTSDSTGKSLYIPKATFSTSGKNVSVSTAGYIPAGTTVGTVANGTMSAVSSDPGNGYTENSSVVLTSGGWLQLTAGYYNATKISLATLVPDSANISNVSGYSDHMLAGTTAYDVDGALITGNIETYDGSYTVLTE